ncbi:MAG: uracil-DNA glycosylase [Alphaproteobacteria bacterium]|nr:uracil-DNA glycosylase [Alphaproteobacteria bacterium]
MLFDPPPPPGVLPLVNYELPADHDSWNGLVFVGEAPGKEEVRLGRPFVGRSGKLLNEMLAEAGIERARSIIANVFRYQPPGNKVDHFFTSRRAAAAQGLEIAEEFGSFGSAWCKKEYSNEINALKDFLGTWRPRVIVALGRTPFWALTEGSGLLLSVGRIHDCRLLPGTPVIPTFHPSYILRGNWSKRPEWLEHFLSAAHYVAQK